MSGSLLKLLRELSQREIEYVVVGGMAAVLHGAPVVTADVDIVHRRTPENVNALLEVLRELEARLRFDTRKLFPSEAHLLGHGHILLATSLGPIDLLCEVQGEGYEELLPYAQDLKLGEGLTTKVLGLEKLIEQKMGAGRPKDHMALPILRATLDELKKRPH